MKLRQRLYLYIIMYCTVLYCNVLCNVMYRILYVYSDCTCLFKTGMRIFAETSAKNTKEIVLAFRYYLEIVSAESWLL